MKIDKQNFCAAFMTSYSALKATVTDKRDQIIRYLSADGGNSMARAKQNV